MCIYNLVFNYLYIVIVILIVIAISGYLAYYYFYNSAVNTVESYDVDYLDDVPEYGQNELEYFEYDYDY